MAIKALIFGVDDLFNELRPYYEMFVQRGEIEIVGHEVNQVLQHTSEIGILIKFTTTSNILIASKNL